MQEIRSKSMASDFLRKTPGGLPEPKVHLCELASATQFSTWAALLLNSVHHALLARIPEICSARPSS